MIAPFQDAAYPADPYPGLRPPHSFVQLDGLSYAVEPHEESASGWRLHHEEVLVDLDEWLAAQEAAPLKGRLPVLAYGSNASPGKIAWLRDTLGLQGPAVVLRAQTEGIAAVWSAGTRARDGQRPAVLAADPGVVEQHAIWLVTPDQRRVLDECEGRGERYRLAWVHSTVRLDDGTSLSRVLAYTARPEVMGRQVPEHLNRSPLLVKGSLVRVADLDQESAARLVGTPASSDGLDCEEVVGEPDTPSGEYQEGAHMRKTH